jgi:hypothetical protein
MIDYIEYRIYIMSETNGKCELSARYAIELVMVLQFVSKNNEIQIVPRKYIHKG